MIGPAILLLAAAAGGTLEPMTSAEFCGRCHRGIYDAWRGSVHASAMVSTLFQDALEDAARENGAAARRTCLGCHAPAAAATGDARLQRKVSWEGVTCDYCHSLSGASKPRVVLTTVRNGPNRDSVSPAHGTAYSELHRSSVLCATCHEYRNALGFPVLKTYTEWSATTHAKSGAVCQSCHMDKAAGSHQMPGSHSLMQLARTVRARLDAVREGNEVHVRVELANRGAGHAMPTGSPLRKVILDVRAEAGDGHRFDGQRTYERVVADAKGAPVKREADAFLRGARELSDTRLASGETRTEVFTFPIAKGAGTHVSASLQYVYSPLDASAPPQRLTFWRLSRYVP